MARTLRRARRGRGDRTVAEAVDRVGRIHVLVSNAGIDLRVDCGVTSNWLILETLPGE
jgi:NAD(P)-dependent dehydrogenase (short-subunit alcohol dehydrogenase family)